MYKRQFLDAPRVLEGSLCLKEHPNVFFAGQITGFEGYMESAASGLLAAHQMLARLNGRELPPPPAATMCGALNDRTSQFEFSFTVGCQSIAAC